MKIFLKSSYSGMVSKHFHLSGDDIEDTYFSCAVTRSHIRTALNGVFMTDAIIDANCVCLRAWCAQNNTAFYPLLCGETACIMGCHGVTVKLQESGVAVKRIALCPAARAGTQIGVVLCVELLHCLSAIFDVKTQFVDVFDSAHGLRSSAKEMSNIVSRLKLLGRLMSAAPGTGNPYDIGGYMDIHLSGHVCGLVTWQATCPNAPF